MEVGEISSKYFTQLLTDELKLEPCQWEERPAPVQPPFNQDVQCFEADSLVHEEWLNSIKEGHVTDSRVPQICQEEIHWLLQPSCQSILPQPWQRVHLMCLRKLPQMLGGSRRTLVPPSSSFSSDSIHEFLTQVSQENLLLSWKEVMQLFHNRPQILPNRTSLTSLFVHELVLQLYNLKVHHIKSEAESSADYKEWSEMVQKSHTSPPKNQLSSKNGCVRNDSEEDKKSGIHPNLSPLLAALESRHAFYFIYPYLRFTLFDVALHSPAMVDDSVAKPLFILYQLLNLLNHCHSKGVTLGDISLKNIFMDSRLWVQIRLSRGVFTGSQDVDDNQNVTEVKSSKITTQRSKVVDQRSDFAGDIKSLVGKSEDLNEPPPEASSPIHSGSSSTLTGAADGSKSSLAYKYVPPALHLCEATHKWRNGELSNFDYLMLLNHRAGRVLGDPNNHPIFPWVMEFTHKDGGYRDLSKSKYRLSKGDRQLDFTYISMQEELRRAPDQESLVPHHIGDISSDVTYYVYLARKTPKEVLCSRVRPQWVPKEYPSSIEKMYTWTPDECIPEFFTDPSIFKSIHPDLPDLAIPSWASSPEELVSIHRSVLEGDIVSANIHNWIDLMFGYKLTGHDAVRAKNVYVSLVDRHKDPKNCGIVQLFKSSHPKRIQATSAPLAIHAWNSYLNMSSMTNTTAFSINQPSPNPFSSTDASRRPSSPHPSDKKTLESIIIEQSVSQQNIPPLEEDGDHIESSGHENQDDDFTGSFEHVNINEVKEKKTPSNVSSSLPSSDIGINYGEVPTFPTGDAKAQARPRGESVVMPTSSNRFRVPVVNMIFNRQRHKGSTLEVEGVYEWQQEKVSLPKEANLLNRLTRLEETAHFAFKSCKDDGSMYKDKWKPEDFFIFNDSSDSDFHPLVKILKCVENDSSYYPSFDERVVLDVVAVTCVMIELCCIKQLRSATPTDPTLFQRVATIRKLLTMGQLRLPSFLSCLSDFVLCPEKRGDLSPNLGELILPSLTPSILLQPFLPVATFPKYFQKLYKFTCHLEQLCHKSGVDYATLDMQRLTHLGLQFEKDVYKRDFDEIFVFVSERIEGLLEVVGDEGFPLLLMHLFPFFQYPETSFDAVYTLLSPLAQNMSQKSVNCIFTSTLIQLFDSATKPHHRGQLFSRTTADIIIRKFGLKTFLNRFLGFLIESVLEPLRMSHSSKITPNIVRMKSQSVLTLMTSELLQSQVYEGGESCDMSGKLSFSLAMSEPGYDSDKECSSEDSEDDIAETSLLAKSSMLSCDAEADGIICSPLIMTAQTVGSSTDKISSGILVDGDGHTVGNTTEIEESNCLNLSMIKETEGHGLLFVNSVNLPDNQKNQLVNSTQDSISLAASAQFEPTRSLASLYSTDFFDSESNFTSSLPSSRLKNGSHLIKNKLNQQASLPIGLMPISSNGFGEEYHAINDEEKEGEDGDTDTIDSENLCSYDPQALAICLNIAEVAADCISWLFRRLGPLLASQHIIRPLIENLHRCFTGIPHLKGKEVPALKCLTSFTECYGETVVKKMYVPLAENLVALATTRMTLRSEAGVAASLGIIKVSVKTLTHATLTECAQEICDSYFLPLIQLLSSQTTFPSGGKARSAICHSMVKLLLLLGENLGRELACEKLGPILQCFFACFSGMHQNEASSGKKTTPPRTKDESDPVKNSSRQADLGMSFPVGSVSHLEGKTVEVHPLTESRNEIVTPTPSSYIQDNEVYCQLCATFSKAVAHFSYINFCKLLGQYYLQDSLRNADMIEQIIYSHDEVANPNSPLVSILTDPVDCNSDTNSDSKSEDDSDDDDVGMARDAALMVGPIAAVTGLNLEEAGFRKSSWFVELEGEESGSTSTNKQSQSSPVKKVNSLEKYVATFDAKFSGMAQHSDTSPAQFSGHGSGGNALPSFGQSNSEQDFTLVGAWEDLWDSQLHEPYQRDGFHNFRTSKLQTYTGPSGHKHAVKCLTVSDGEHFFLSGSKDKTVKIWSLCNGGRSLAAVGCQLTYNGHQKPVMAVELLEMTDTVASCDGTVQLWDPETGYLLHQFTSPRSSSFVTMRSLSISQSVLVAGTSDTHLRFIDTRMKSFLHLWKLQFPTGGIIRSVACADNWLSVGNQNGTVNSLDIRTGELLSLWKPLDFATVQATAWNESLLQMKATCRGNLVTSVGSGLLSLWKPNYGKLLYHLKGQNHNTNCLEVVGDQLISAATNGNIVIHTSFESRDCHHVSYRTKKSVTALASLQQNRLLLLGHENGSIVLMA